MLSDRILMIIVVLRSSISILGIAKVASCCSRITASPELLLERSIARLESLTSKFSSGGGSVEGDRWRSRWISEDLRNFHNDLRNSVNDQSGLVISVS